MNPTSLISRLLPASQCEKSNVHVLKSWEELGDKARLNLDDNDIDLA